MYNDVEQKERELTRKIVMLHWHLTFVGSHDRQKQVKSRLCSK